MITWNAFKRDDGAEKMMDIVYLLDNLSKTEGSWSEEHCLLYLEYGQEEYHLAQRMVYE